MRSSAIVDDISSHLKQPQQSASFEQFPLQPTFSITDVPQYFTPSILEQTLRRLDNTRVWSETLKDGCGYEHWIDHNGTRMSVHAPVDAQSKQRYLFFRIQNLHDHPQEWVRARIDYIMSCVPSVLTDLMKSYRSPSLAPNHTYADSAWIR
ncbi:MAG TPA: hypothetical protein VK158_02640 [Acidobacteriota bacterium]|nr:hypothetical protein [Acidobacteriota bacterium]